MIFLCFFILISKQAYNQGNNGEHESYIENMASDGNQYGDNEIYGNPNYFESSANYDVWYASSYPNTMYESHNSTNPDQFSYPNPSHTGYPTYDDFVTEENRPTSSDIKMNFCGYNGSATQTNHSQEIYDIRSIYNFLKDESTSTYFNTDSEKKYLHGKDEKISQQSTPLPKNYDTAELFDFLLENMETDIGIKSLKEHECIKINNIDYDLVEHKGYKNKPFEGNKIISFLYESSEIFKKIKVV